MSAKCPKCRSEIDHIDWLESRRIHIVVLPSGDTAWKDDYSIDDGDEAFECPICSERIASSVEESVALLNQEETTDGETKAAKDNQNDDSIVG